MSTTIRQVSKDQDVGSDPIIDLPKNYAAIGWHNFTTELSTVQCKPGETINITG